MMKFKFLDHTADLKFQLYGNSLNDIFENCAEALSEYLARGQEIKPAIKKEIMLKESNNESLLYSFIDELIYLLDAEGFIVRKAKVKIEENLLKAEIYGDKAEKYNLNHVKAATYSEMYIKESGKKWEAQAVVDV